jgi:hypothetical protein
LATSKPQIIDCFPGRRASSSGLPAGEVLYMTSLYDMEELRRFKKGEKKMKKEMRSKK